MGEDGARPDTATRFKKGVSGNPSGKPKGYAEFQALCREKTTKAVEALELMLSDPDNCVSAAKALLEFGWGKARQSVEHSGAGGEPFQLVLHGKGR